MSTGINFKTHFCLALGKRSSKHITKEESKVMAFESQQSFKNLDQANIITNQKSVSSVFSSAVLTSQQKVRGLNPLLQQLVNRQKKGRKHEATDQ